MDYIKNPVMKTMAVFSLENDTKQFFADLIPSKLKNNIWESNPALQIITDNGFEGRGEHQQLNHSQIFTP